METTIYDLTMIVSMAKKWLEKRDKFVFNVENAVVEQFEEKLNKLFEEENTAIYYIIGNPFKE